MKNIAVQATHDAKARSSAPRCYPKTRVAVQTEISEWMRQDHGPVAQMILWVTGPAGAGKTAIAGSLADAWSAKNMLAASFFFSAIGYSSTCKSTKYFVPTLAYQLLQHPELCASGLEEHLFAAIQKNPVVFDQALHVQFEALILKPLRNLDTSSKRKWPKAILIDGLDECDADPSTSSSDTRKQQSKADVHTGILSTLLRATNDPSFPFRIIVVSRPEYAISRFFDRHNGKSIRIFLDDAYNPDVDITHFIEEKLATIRERLSPIEPEWPPNREHVVRTLVRNASGQFVYAAIAMGYIDSEDDSGEHPGEKLHRIVQGDEGASNPPPFEKLDALFECILQTSPNPTLAVQWIHAILELQTESTNSVTMVRAFLERRGGEMKHLLGSLASLISITDTFKFFHKSLHDFLGSSIRSKALYISPEITKGFLQDRWYELLKSKSPPLPPFTVESSLASDRGPQTHLKPVEHKYFLEHYAGSLTTRYLHLSAQGYHPNDVEWWTTTACAELLDEREDKIQNVHEIVHEAVSAVMEGCPSGVH